MRGLQFSCSMQKGYTRAGGCWWGEGEGEERTHRYTRLFVHLMHSSPPSTQTHTHTLSISLRNRIERTCACRLVFSVGEKPMENFRMIERHYHDDTLVRSYDFDFGFCIPMSKNSWEALYPLPVLEKEQIQRMVRESIA